MKRIITLIAFAIIANGCAYTKFSLPGGGSFKRVSLGTDIGIKRIEVGTNGTASVEGIMSKQAQTAAMVTEAAVSAAIKGAK